MDPEDSDVNHDYQDMHYAEFGEDEVCLSLFVPASVPDQAIVDSFARGHQRIRSQQMESHRTKGRKTSKGKADCSFGNLSNAYLLCP